VRVLKPLAYKRNTRYYNEKLRGLSYRNVKEFDVYLIIHSKLTESVPK